MSFRSDRIRRIITKLITELKFRERLGEELKNLIVEEYLAKSQGQKDSFNKKWKETQSSNPIGIRTGELLRHMRVDTTDTTIRIYIDDAIDYANYFNAVRPIFPEELQDRRGTIPARWREVITRTIIEYVNLNLPERLREFRIPNKLTSKN